MDRKQVWLMAALTALTLVAGGAAVAAMTTLGDTPARITDAEEVAFPADDLRTAKTPPKIELINQDGEAVSLASLKGKVVIVTAVYATCHAACPTIITEMKSAVMRLTPEQRDQVSIIAITLDPKGDTLDKRAMTAKAHGLDAPLFNYVNGDDPDAVLALVEELGWARVDAGADGVIGHSNMFMLVDKAGKIAYTVSADTQVDWLNPALEVLLAE